MSGVTNRHDDRYEPLPSLPELPRWVWRRMSRPTRIAAGLAALAIVATAVAFVPGLRESQREADERAGRERAAQRAELVRRLEAEQRPVTGRTTARDPGQERAAAWERLAARTRVVRDLSGAIVADARSRAERGELSGRIRRVACEAFPRTLGRAPEDDLSRRHGRYSCIAVTAEFERGAIGHLYRARADFATGRYAFCKIAGRPGPEREQLVRIPRACGG
jgi:hypothetical protein